jgi:hypothetical protein
VVVIVAATQHRRLLNIVSYSTSSVIQHHQPCPQAQLRDELRKPRITRPHRLLDLTNLRIYELCQIYLLVIFEYFNILIHVQLYYTITNTTHDTLILLMIH